MLTAAEKSSTLASFEVLGLESHDRQAFYYLAPSSLRKGFIHQLFCTAVTV